MTYLANELVNKAWYLSGIIAREQETVPGSYTTEGLFLLNSLLDIQSATTTLIPYYKYHEFNMVQGQELYTIPNLLQIQTLTFNIGDVRYPMTECNDVKYFGTGRVDNIQSLPFLWNLMRVNDGSELRVYYLPQGNYVSHLFGKFGLTNVTLNQDMLAVYDAMYLEYVRYALADLMCDEWDVEFSASKKNRLMVYEKKLTYVQPPDLSVQKVQLLGKRNAMSWAQANIGKGFTP